MKLVEQYECPRCEDWGKFWWVDPDTGCTLMHPCPECDEDWKALVAKTE